MRDGAATFFYRNGKREALGRFIAGKKNGLWEHFHENGFLKERGTYKDDVKVGVWTLYDELGRPTGEIRH